MKRLICILALVWLAAGCASPGKVTVIAPTPTASQPPTPSLTQTLTGTPVPATLTATPLLIEGTLTIKVNVRGGPGTSYASLGQLDAGVKVQISVRDPTGQWYQILFPAAANGLGWVTAQYVQVPAGTAVPREATPTASGPSGRVLQLLNVRSGPGMTFNSLGTLQPNVVVYLTGKNSTSAWFQIDYPSGPGGHGWVTAQYIQTDATGLPVLDDYGTPVATGTPGQTSSVVPSTPTVGPAYADGDSAANPGVNVLFSATGTRQFTYSSQVSAPQGDPEDRIEFTPYAVDGNTARLLFSLACSGNAALTVELWQGGSLLSGWGTLSCGNMDQLVSLSAGKAYEMRLAPAPGDGLRLVGYSLTVQNLP